MTERGLPGVDGAPACPFVAFEDDRETRATSPDHRHRCYAELVPSPRAVAHQEAYCLSSAFPVCPTFQDWARREAAHARGEGDRPRAALTVMPEASGEPGDAPEPREPRAARRASADRDAADERPHDPLDEPPIRRNPPRDWAAPPPWASGASGSTAGGAARSGSGDAPGTPGFLAGRDESRGLAGSAADRLAAGSGAVHDGGPPTPFDSSAAAGPDAELAGLVSGRPIADRPAPDYLPPNRSTRRPTVSSTRGSSRDREREREREAIVGPAWEHARRYEAYPTIRSRTGLPAPPRLAILAGALVVAALALFFLPALLGVGGGGGGTATKTPGASASGTVSTASLAPTTPPEPTPQVYVIKSGDTLSKVAKAFGLTLEELLAANTETITDPDKIAAGDEIIIPVKPPDEFTDPSAEPS
jgi:nucleoid-associated protein YgaU